jgi:hypothetical protein
VSELISAKFICDELRFMMLGVAFYVLEMGFFL